MDQDGSDELNSAPDGWVRSPRTVRVSPVDELSGVAEIRYRLDASDWATCTGDVVVSGEGEHTLQYRAVDAAGNIETERQSTVFIDDTAPQTTSTAVASYTNTATIGFTATDGLSGVATTRWRLNGGSWSTEPTLRLTVGGTYNLEFQSVDWAGNTEAVRSATFSLTRRHESQETRLFYKGTWAHNTSGTKSGGTWHYTYTPGSGMYFQFRGTGFDLISSMSNAYGIALVTVDNTTSTVDFYSSSTKHQQKVMSVSNLSDGLHTVKIQWTGQRNPASSKPDFGIDAVDLRGYLVDPVIRFEQDVPEIAYEEIWANNTSTSRSSGSWAFTYTQDSNAYVKFRGTGIDLISSKSAAYGIAQITLDGVATSTVDFYSTSSKHQQRVWSVTGLDDGEHTVSIKWTGTKNPASSKPDFGIDAVDVYGGYLLQATVPPKTRYENSSGLMVWDGPWAQVASSTRSGGSWAYTYQPESVANIRFNGTAFDLISSKGSAYGIAKLTLDGVVHTVDLYSASTLHKQKVFSANGLAPGDHTLTIESTGTKNAASSKADFGIDAMDVAVPLQAVSSIRAQDPLRELDRPRLWDGPWAQIASTRVPAAAGPTPTSPRPWPTSGSRVPRST